MASEHDISQVWLGLLDAERLTRYYAAMAVRLQRWHMGLTAFVATGSTGAVGSLLFDAPNWVAEVLAGAVAVAAVWTSYCGHASKAATMEAARDGCADLALLWRDLWARLEGLDGADAWGEIRNLRRREELVTARVPSHLAERHGLNVRCAKDAYSTLGNEYAVGY